MSGKKLLGVNVMILKNRRKIWRKYWRFRFKIQLTMQKKVIITLVFDKISFLSPKIGKKTKNRNHNFSPWVARHFLLFSKVSFRLIGAYLKIPSAGGKGFFLTEKSILLFCLAKPYAKLDHCWDLPSHVHTYIHTSPSVLCMLFEIDLFYFTEAAFGNKPFKQL
jgi:hypothetical protein